MRREDLLSGLTRLIALFTIWRGIWSRAWVARRTVVFVGGPLQVVLNALVQPLTVQGGLLKGLAAAAVEERKLGCVAHVPFDHEPSPGVGSEGQRRFVRHYVGSQAVDLEVTAELRDETEHAVV